MRNTLRPWHRTHCAKSAAAGSQWHSAALGPQMESGQLPPRARNEPARHSPAHGAPGSAGGAWGASAPSSTRAAPHETQTHERPKRGVNSHKQPKPPSLANGCRLRRNLGLAGYVTGGDMTGIDNNSCTKPHMARTERLVAVATGLAAAAKSAQEFGGAPPRGRNCTTMGDHSNRKDRARNGDASDAALTQAQRGAKRTSSSSD